MSQTTGAYNRIRRRLLRERGRSHQRHIDIPINGSCSECHHFHVNCVVPYDTTTHTRVRCEQCGRHMFGLGSTTTQCTLASVNTGTMIFPRGCVDQRPRQARSQGETVAVEDTQNANLNSPNPDHHLSFQADQMAERPDHTREGNIQEPLRHTVRKRLKQWCSRPRKWSSSIRTLVQRLSITARNARPPARTASVTTSNVSIGASSPPSISQTPPGDSTNEPSESVTRAEPPSSDHHMNEQGEPSGERLRILRHRKTEQRKRELSVQCLCSQHCLCLNEGNRASDVACIGSESQTRSRMQIEQSGSSHPPNAPGHSLSGNSSETTGTPPPGDFSQGTSLSHIGDQFGNQLEHRPLSPDMLGLITVNSQRQNTFVPTSTIDTNRSSITLSGGTASAAAGNQNTPLLSPTPEPDIHHYLSANPDDATSSHYLAEGEMRNALLDPNLISSSPTSFGSNPRHESQVDHEYIVERTSLQVDEIASEHTGEESEMGASTETTHDKMQSIDPTPRLD